MSAGRTALLLGLVRGLAFIVGLLLNNVLLGGVAGFVIGFGIGALDARISRARRRRTSSPHREDR